jgi:phosphoglycolate phosphatase-like HAD superfamily hydrolase
MEVAPTQTRFMPDALPTIKAFHESGIRVGVVSYKPLPLIEAIIDGMGLARYLSVVRAPSLGNPPGSKTRLLLDTIEHLRPFRSQPLFIGDHDDDGQAAKEVPSISSGTPTDRGPRSETLSSGLSRGGAGRATADHVFP